jgi:hypothetical protein
MPNCAFVRRLLVLAPLLVVAAGCGGAAATGDLDKIQVTLGRFDVSVTNTSGRTLLEVVVEIAPTGPGSPFVAHPDRLENGQTRSLAHTSFMDHDSVPFSPRNTKATRVTVVAKDMDGRPVRVEVPFKS